MLTGLPGSGLSDPLCHSAGPHGEGAHAQVPSWGILHRRALCESVQAQGASGVSVSKAGTAVLSQLGRQRGRERKGRACCPGPGKDGPGGVPDSTVLSGWRAADKLSEKAPVLTLFELDSPG